MTIGILIYSGPAQEAYTAADRLTAAAEKLGHQVIKLYEPLLSISENEILHEGLPLPHLDVIIARPNFVAEPSLHQYVTDKLLNVCPVINGAGNISASKNKIAQHLLFEKHQLPCPRWGIARNSKDLCKLAEEFGYPVILKVAFGTHGKGVFYADKREVLDPIAGYISIRDGNPLIIEEFIAEANRTDLRIFLIGGEVIAAMERKAPEGDVRANTSTGGTGHKVVLTDEEISLAKRVTELFQLDISGVDLIRSKRGPLIIEINANPGFTELERITGVDVAGAIIEYATKNTTAVV